MQPGTSLETAYRRYVEKGAFPYVLQIADDSEMVREYLLGLYNTIVLKDVVARKRMTDVMMLESIVRFPGRQHRQSFCNKAYQRHTCFTRAQNVGTYCGELYLSLGRQLYFLPGISL